MRALIRRLDGWMITLLLLICAGAIGFLATRHTYIADWSSSGRASLSAPSRAVLAKLNAPMDIISYANPQGGHRQIIAAFVHRYQQVDQRISLRFVDPQLDPAKMRELGITVDGTLILHYKGREQRLTSELSDSALTDVIERLIRGSDRIVAFVTGDGERRADGQANADLGTFMTQLEQRGMRAVPLNFSQVSAVPEHTDLVVLASPDVTLAPAAAQALAAYVQNGGNLLWLTDPGNDDLGLKPLTAVLGVRALPGVLVDGSGAALGLHDPRMLALGDYPPSAITRGFMLTTQFPQVSALAQVSQGEWRVEPFLRSSAQSWTEFKPIDNTHSSDIHFDPSIGELKGPLNFGLALSRLSPSPDKSEQRVVVIGDGDFLSNAFLGHGSNRALGERIFNWLLGDNELVDLPARGSPPQLLNMSQSEFNLVFFGFLLVLPLLLLLIGGAIVWRRRRR
ncbi:MAG TPA: DUF4350 domain-containing protein [Rhodanobacter sp.]|nr:DUF4350 domain-containing protein [Rhodanobacter sp.]